MTEPSTVTRVPLDKGQRYGVALLICLTLIIIAVSFLQIHSSIFSPLKKESVATATTATQSEEEILKKRDTDKDGVSDYDEIYVFHTSPYIRDTDSDGIPDGDEIKRGTNPLCPEGKDCSMNSIIAPDATTASSSPAAANDNASSTIGLAAPIDQSAAANSANANSAATAAQLTPAQLRSMLIEQGVPKEKLAGISDADLIKLLAEAQADLNKNSPAPKQP